MIKSRTKAKEAIKNGGVKVNGKQCVLPSFEVGDSDEVTVEALNDKYVSRAGYKLEKALDEFEIDVSGMTALDIGASSGGFTDCLLQRGAKKVYAIDVGSSQLDASLLNDGRVVSRENTNAKTLKKSDFDSEIDIIVMDVSFISQRKLYPNAADILSKGKIFVSLIKPQFELGRQNIGKGGIVKDARLFQPLINEIAECAAGYGFKLIRTIESPIKGGDGNTEFLALFIKEADI